MRRNQITGIEENSFEGASRISELYVNYTWWFNWSLHLFCYRLLSENKLREVHNKMFLGLHSLKVLSLNNNEITCIMPGSFDYLTSLHTL